MGIKLPRKKPRNLKLSLAYRLLKWIPASQQTKLKWLLDWSWIFSRLAHEQTFVSGVKPVISDTEDIILDYVRENGSVLDIGCGEGDVIRRIVSRTRNIVGIDYNQRSIDVARKAIPYPDVTLLCEDVVGYLDRNEKVQFDCIILSHVLEHLDGPEQFMKGICGHGQYIYVEVPDFEQTHLNQFRQAVDTDLLYTDADHVSEFDRRDMENMFASSGLKILRSEFRYGLMKYWTEKQR